MHTNVRGQIIYDCIFILLGIWQTVYLFGWVFLLAVDETCSDVFPMMPVWEFGVATVSIFSFVIAFLQYVAAETVFKSEHEHETEGEETSNKTNSATTKQENAGNNKNQESQKQNKEVCSCNGASRRIEQNNTGPRDQEKTNNQSEKTNIQSGKQKYRNNNSLETSQSHLNLDSFWILVMVLHFFWLIFGTVTVIPGFFTEELYDGVHTLNKKGCHSPSHFWFSFLCLCMEWIFLLQLVVMTRIYLSNPSLVDDSRPRNQSCDRSHNRTM